MPVAAVQEGGASGSSVTSVARAFSSNVTAGEGRKVIIGVWGALEVANDNPIVAGDITTAGTATLGAWTLHAQGVEPGGSYNFRSAVLSADITGTGSLTVTFGSQPVSSYISIAAGEYSGVGAVVATNSANAGSGTAVDSGNVTLSGGGIIFGAACIDPDSGVDIVITPDGAFTTVFEEEDYDLYQTGSAIRRLVDAALTDSASWTPASGTEWSAAVVAFNQLTPRTLGSMGCGR